MEISKKAVFYRLEAEPSLEAKKQVLNSIISSISMLKALNKIKELEKQEGKTVSDINEKVGEIRKKITAFIECMPKAETAELKSKLKPSRKTVPKAKASTESKEFESELEEIKARLSRL
jgi:hypothetical protein